MQLSGVCAHFDRKTRGPEDVQHAVICSDYLGLKDLYSVGDRYLCELTQQYAAQSAALKVVRDGKRDFSSFIGDGNIESVTDHTLVFTTNSHQSEGLIEVSFSMGFRRNRCSVLVTVKTEPAGFF